MAAKQRQADLLLELADLLTDCGLGSADALRRAIQAAQLMSGQQRSHHIHIEIRWRHDSVFPQRRCRIIAFLPEPFGYHR
ncbi:hypothetical protein, partial [Burkholderia sp. MSMB1589WGS]|uniref:hypothetical protein n=1 Tax=Burkholderia sp. MSMB1589WGS TaxID=1636425 RepID=UPI0032B7F225